MWFITFSFYSEIIKLSLLSLSNYPHLVDVQHYWFAEPFAILHLAVQALEACTAACWNANRPFYFCHPDCGRKVFIDLSLE